MKIKIKVNDFNVDADNNMEAIVDVPDFYAMLDRLNTSVITTYIYMRLKDGGKGGEQ